MGMKTKEQVKKYLGRRYFEPDDWRRILDFCHERYGSGIHKALRPKSKSDWNGFMDWLKNGVADGDVVRFGGFVGIAVDNGDNTYTIPAYDNGDIIFDKMVIDNVCMASESETEHFYTKLRKLGYSFSVSLSQVCKRKLPGAWSKVSVFVDGKKHIGIVKEYTETTAVMAFVIGNPLNEGVIYDLDKVVIEKADRAECGMIRTFLGTMSLAWNESKNVLEPTIKRSVAGKPYWYITDKFGIARSIERMTKISDIRYENHNYFSDYRDAVEFRDHIYDYRISQIKKPG